MLDPRLLRIFVAVAEELHFGRAAQAVGLSQSTLSGQLRRLEDVVGGPLLVRGRRAAVRLTEAGAVLLDEARAALGRLDQAEAVARGAVRGEAGPFPIGYVFSAAPSGVLPALLRLLRATAPHLAPAPRLADTPEQLAGVAAGRLAVGLCRSRPSYPPGLRAAVVHREPLGLLVAGDHRLATGAPPAAAELATETFLLPQFDERHGLLPKLDRLAAQGGFAAAPVRLNDYVTAAAMTAAGLGITLAPRSLARLGLDGLTFVEVAGFDEAIETALLWRTGASPLIDRLAAALVGPTGLDAAWW